jgi:hypothetical protein
LTARNFGRDFLRYLRSADASRQPTHLLASALTTLRTKEKIMRTSLRTSTLVLAILGSISCAAAQRYLFIKLPDRIVLIDPDTNMVAAILGDSAAQSAASRRAKSM